MTRRCARAGVAPAKIARLKRTASRVSQLAARGPLVRVALAANAVSGLMPELYAHFRDRVPPSVLTLDYLDREAQLRSLVLERARVDVAVKRLVSTWAPLRPKGVAAGGAAPEAPVSTRPARLSSIYLVIAEAVRRNPPRPPR